MPDPLARAVAALRRGRIVGYPTDTLYGLGVRARDVQAVRRLQGLKERPGGMPLSVAFSSLEEVERWADLSPMARRFCRTHLPGPWTVLLRTTPLARRQLPREILGGGLRLGVRLPDHPVARELARRAGPLTATSANRHGEPPCRGPTEARRIFGGAIAVYLRGHPRSGRPSTIVDLTGAEPRPIRRS